jgi:hypothetical protein
MKETAIVYVVNDSLLLDVFNIILHDSTLWENYTPLQHTRALGQFNCSEIQKLYMPPKNYLMSITNLLSELQCVIFLALSYFSFLYRSQN